MEIQSKIPDVGLTIFAVMTKLSNDHGAINLSQGFPDFATHPELISLVEKYMLRGDNQYAPMQGVMDLRVKIGDKTRDLYGTSYDAETEITVTAGATESLFAAITAVVRQDDEVIIFEPAYDAYSPVVQLNGGRPVYIQMKPPDYRIDWDEVKDKMTQSTRLIILNSPHNPSGSILLPSDMESLIEITRDTSTFILSDEVYEHIIFDGRKHESISCYPELAARSFVVSSFGKTYHTTGWKIGYTCAPRPLSSEFQRIHQFITYAVNTPIQLAYAEFLDRKELYMDLSAFYEKKRDLFVSSLENSRFTALPCHGTYFQMMGYENISDESDMEFAKRMTIEYGVASIPPSVFYNDINDYKVLRFCFAKRDETIEKAAEKLCRI